MTHKIFRRGTIACSAIIIYSAVQPSTSASATQECHGQSITPLAQVLKRVKHACMLENIAMPPQAAPESLLNANWSDRRLNKLPKTVEALYSNSLEQAQVIANRNQPAAAIRKIAGIPKNSQHFKVAQQLQEDWSQELLQQATRECHQARVARAITMLNQIPSPHLQTRILELRQSWQQQGQWLNRAIAAKNANDWQGMINALDQLEETPLYNSVLVQGLLQQATSKLYEPDATMLQVAAKGLPTIHQPVAVPESIQARF
jgi:hypothetical protein